MNAPRRTHRRLRVLFVCAMNRQRSVTAERLYRNDPRLEVRSAGVRTGAVRRISEGDLRWADVVYVMESDQKRRIQTEFRDLELPMIEVLEIPDVFAVMDPELIEILRATLDPEIEQHLHRKPPP
ncbi:low molecular weight protein tyrosine phosphatase family protein [Opitutales bacterium ASA1]|nr:low molecular weight protein tyrosine phosphatase family protein [Opitutales bacterium ASA1]